MFQASMKDRAEAATQQSVEAMATLAGMSPMRGVPASLKHPYAYSDSPRRDPHPSSPGVYGMQSPREHSQQLPGQNAPYLADSPYTKSHSRDNSVQARKMNAARISYSPRGLQASVAAEIKANGTREASTLGFLNQRVQDGTISGVPPRPQSASVVAGRTQIGARSMTSWRDHLDIEVENPVLSEQNEDSEIRRAGGGGDRENPNAGLIDLIENRAYGSSAGAGGGSGSNLGSLVDGQIRGETAGVGNMIDEEIRERQSTGPGLGSVGHDSVGGKKKKESQSVKERILDGTKRIYNNKNMFKEMAEPESLLEIMKRKGAGQGDKKVSTIPLALERGGGQISVNTASTVRSKLISARDKDDGIRMKHAGQNNELHPRDTSKRPASAPSGRSKREKGKAVSAHASKLMSSLQKLNPAVLF
jgi:hypothetical protein